MQARPPAALTSVVRNTHEERGRRGALPRLLGLVLAAGLSLLAVAGGGQAAFPGVNGKIAFVTGRDGNLEIYAMNADGSGKTRLTNNTADDSDPAWSPDGTKIAFSSDRDGNREIYVMNADGSGQKRLTNNAADDFDPAWSPDGAKIAFATTRNGKHDTFGNPSWGIYVMNAADGSGQTGLTSDPTNDIEPAWSPDGTKIAFASDRPDGRVHNIYVMSATDGSAQTALTSNTSFDSRFPAWSPDGTKIAFSSLQFGTFDLFSINAADGSGRTRLTTDSDNELEPAWSPDGTKIVFVIADPELSSSSLFAMNAAPGSSATQLTLSQFAADPSVPDWQTLVPADLQLGVSGPTKAASNSQITYTITLDDLGPGSASGITITYALPVPTTFVRASTSQGSCSTPAVGSTGALRCSVGTLAKRSGKGLPGASQVQINVTVTVPPLPLGKTAETLTNTAAVSSTSIDPSAANNTSSVSTFVSLPVVGTFRLSPARTVAHVGVAFALDLTWVAPGRWRDLRTVELELRDGTRPVGLVRFLEDGTKTGRLSLGGRSGKPGENHVLTSGPISLRLAQSRVKGSGPTGKSVAIHLALQPGAKLAGHTLELLLGATDDHGVRQPFRAAGTLIVHG